MLPHSRHPPSLRPRNRHSEAHFRGLTSCLLQLRTKDTPRKRSLPPLPIPLVPPLITHCAKPWLELPATLLPPRRSPQRKQFPHAPRPRRRLTRETRPTQPSMTHNTTLAAAPMTPRPRHGKWGGPDLITIPPGARTPRRPQPRLDLPCIACKMLQTRFQHSCTSWAFQRQTHYTHRIKSVTGGNATRLPMASLR